jgi:hypothetical protein
MSEELFYASLDEINDSIKVSRDVHVFLEELDKFTFTRQLMRAYNRSNNTFKFIIAKLSFNIIAYWLDQIHVVNVSSISVEAKLGIVFSGMQIMGLKNIQLVDNDGMVEIIYGANNNSFLFKLPFKII